MRAAVAHGAGAGTGFTLIEVLIALAIVAVALGAVMRAIGALASDTDMARMRLLALWSADNALGEIRIVSTRRPSAPTRLPDSQGRYRFVCRQSVAALPELLVRRVTVSVSVSVEPQRARRSRHGDPE